MPTSPDRILSMQEAADHLGMSVSDLLRLVRATTIWSVEMPDGSHGVRQSEIELFLAGEPPPQEEE